MVSIIPWCIAYSSQKGILRSNILGDPGAVSRVGRKGEEKVFKYGQKSPRVPTLTDLFPKIQADAASWLGTKNTLYHCAQSANSPSWVLYVSSYATARINCLDHGLSGSCTEWYINESNELMSHESSHESMSQWVRSKKNKSSVETIKLSITFTYFVYFLHCCLHKAYFDLDLGCLLAVPRPCRIVW